MNDAIANCGLQSFGHIACKGVSHTFGEAYLLVAAIHRTVGSRHTLEVRIHTPVGTIGMRHVLPNEPSQTLGAQRTRIGITNRIAFLGFLNQSLFCNIHDFYLF